MFGLIGRKIGHSFSAKFFNEKFLKEGIDESYHLFPLEKLDSFPDLIKEHPDLKGLNVTIPYKQEIFQYLNEISPEAKEIGAVNVIKIKDSEKNDKKENGNKLSHNISDEKYLIGYNTDYKGFMDSLVPYLKKDVNKALILGTGGASKAVEYVLKQFGIDYLKVSRNPQQDEIGYEDIDENMMKSHKLIINTTPVGMYPNVEECPSIPYNLLTPDHICYDVIYNPTTTLFLKKAEEKGATIKNGIEMLHLQALYAWEIWSK